MTDVATQSRWNPPPREQRRAFFAEHGWVQLDDVLPTTTVEELRDELLRMMRADLGNRDNHVAELATDEYSRLGQVVNEPSRYSPLVREIATSPTIGEVMREVMGVPRIRLMRDLGINKAPVDDEGIATGVHQDLPFYPVATDVEAAIWIALADLDEHAGTLRFIDGSHHGGAKGRWVLPGQDWLAEHPEDVGALTPAPAMRAGSATIHHGYTLHGTDPNRSNQYRLAYTVAYIDADAPFTGAPSRWTDDLGLTIDQPLDHPYFPLAR